MTQKSLHILWMYLKIIVTELVKSSPQYFRWLYILDQSAHMRCLRQGIHLPEWRKFTSRCSKMTEHGLSSALLLLPQEKWVILVAKQIQNYLEIKDWSCKGLFFWLLKFGRMLITISCISSQSYLQFILP